MSSCVCQTVCWNPKSIVGIEIVDSVSEKVLIVATMRAHMFILLFGVLHSEEMKEQLCFGHAVGMISTTGIVLVITSCSAPRCNYCES